MDWVGQLVRLLHILTAIALIAGIVGRQLTRSEAGKTTDFHAFESLAQLSGRFETLLVQPGSILLLVFGLLTAWLRGWPLFGFLQGSTQNWLLASLILFLAIIPLVALIFIPRGRLFERAMAEARAKRRVTPALQAAFRDPTVALAHWVEGVLVAVIVLLMILKPF